MTQELSTPSSALRTTGCLALLAAAAIALGGCAGLTATSTPRAPIVIPVASTGFAGQVMGGQQPVAGVTIQLYAAGTTGYGSAATPLLTPGAVTTTAAGNFTLPSYTCPAAAPATPIYLVGQGGTPIGPPPSGTPNNNLALMVGLGPCNAVSSSAFINVNELTTVATVWAAGRFMTGIANIGAPPSNVTGLANAFAAINNVVNTANGKLPGLSLPAGATLPLTEINALGNILQNCVNSGGGAASDTTDGLTNGTPCGKLFFLTTTSSAPTDVITAAMNIAQNPGVNTMKLDALQSTSPAFSPALSVNSPPGDWTIAITYTGGGLNTPQSIANDAAGNVWVTNPGINSVTELSGTGAPLSPAAGFTAGSLNLPYGIAIDPSSNVWVTNSGNNTLTELSPGGTTGTVFSGNGLSTPKGLALDGAGNVWVANSAGSSISEFSNFGAAVGSYTGSGINAPVSIAINPK